VASSGSTDLIFHSKSKNEIISFTKWDDISAGKIIGKPLTVFYNLKKMDLADFRTDLAKIFGDVPRRIKVDDFNGDGKINADDRSLLGSVFLISLWFWQTDSSLQGTRCFVLRFSQIWIHVRSQFTQFQFPSLGRYNTLAVDYWRQIILTNAYSKTNQNQERPKV